MRRPAAVLLALALACLAALAAAAPAAEPKYQSCGRLQLSPDAGDLATSIQARHVSCRFARAFIRATDGVPGREARGYRCGRKRFAGTTLMLYSQYRCVRGERIMRWKRY